MERLKLDLLHITCLRDRQETLGSGTNSVVVRRVSESLRFRQNWDPMSLEEDRWDGVPEGSPENDLKVIWRVTRHYEGRLEGKEKGRKSESERTPYYWEGRRDEKKAYKIVSVKGIILEAPPNNLPDLIVFTMVDTRLICPPFSLWMLTERQYQDTSHGKVVDFLLLFHRLPPQPSHVPGCTYHRRDVRVS